MVANHLMPALGQVKVSALRAEDVERLLDEKGVKGLARSSLVKLHSYLGKAYDAGVRRRLVGWESGSGDGDSRRYGEAAWAGVVAGGGKVAP